MYRVNIGCGATPTPGWINFDNSATVRLARVPGLPRVLRRVRLLNDAQHAFADAALVAGVRWADAGRRIPLGSGTAEVVYSSHMLEHLDPDDAKRFLGEAHRILAPGGVLRIAVPDLALLISEYLSTHNADSFVRATLLTHKRPRTVRERLQAMVYGHRDHHWMYDEKSLAGLLGAVGFHSPQRVGPGETTIPNPGDLDLRERAAESLYMEARR